MVRFAFAFLIVGFVAAFFGFAGVASGSLDVAKGLFLVCLIGFIVSMGFIASESRRVSR